MHIKKIHWIGIIVGAVVCACSFLLYNTNLFFFMIWMGVLIAASPFVLSTVKETKEAQEKEDMFLEFTRNLVESVKTGTPISKSIVNMKKKPFGVLSTHIEKLANQISLGIPLKTALETFANDVENITVSRTITLIAQAERAGGNIGQILEAVAKAVAMADKLKKERKAAISTLVAEGYIIFFVFMVIILVMQFYITPMISGISNIGSLGLGGIGVSVGASSNDSGNISQSFIYLLIVQGIFSGLIIGKLSAGTIKAGVKHSFFLVFSSFAISTIANIIFGGK